MTIFLTIVFLILFVVALLFKLGYLAFEYRETQTDDEIPGVRGHEFHISFNRHPNRKPE